jgi:hypothetical protein
MMKLYLVNNTPPLSILLDRDDRYSTFGIKLQRKEQWKLCFIGFDSLNPSLFSFSYLARPLLQLNLKAAYVFLFKFN